MNSNLDMALVGNNYLTYLLSLGLLDKGKKLLILDDERFNYGENFTESLTHLDVEMLKRWGEEAQINALINIESYIERRPYTLVIGRKQVLLGRAPHENIRELKRKFSFAFNAHPEINSDLNQEDIDHLFFLTTSDLSSFLFNDYKNKKLNEFIDNQLEVRVKESFNFFFDSFFKAQREEFSIEEKNDFHCLVYTARGILQNRLGISAHKTEALHLFLGLIAPCYKLNHKKLVSDLMDVYKDKGGLLKKVNLDDLNYGTGFIQKFAIESFDGMMRPKKMLFIGGYPKNLGVKLNQRPMATYQCLKVKTKLNKNIPVDYIKRIFIFSSSIKIGTDRPYWQVEFTSANEASFHVIMNEKEATKVEFYKKTLEKILTNDLNYMFAELDIGLVLTQLNFTKDILVDDRNVFSYKKKDKDIKKISFNPFSPTHSLLRPRAKNALYFGPYFDSWLGRYSSYVELRRWTENL